MKYPPEAWVETPRRIRGYRGQAECGCVPGHRMSILSQTCLDCGLTEREVFDGKAHPCIMGTP